MKFETVIIGGGISGLVSGIKLAKKGKNVAIVSSGQSALHFFSGSFELLGNANGETVTNPAEAIMSLPESHPYRRIGKDNICRLLKEVKPLLSEAGIKANGDENRNHYRLTPLGMFKPSWLTLDDYATVEDAGKLPWKKAAIINLGGYLDFYPKYLAYGLGKHGVECTINHISLPQLEILRKSPSEMRATNIAKALTFDVLEQLANQMKGIAGDADIILFPAVLGLFNDHPVEFLREKLGMRIGLVPTMPTSVPGVRTQITLRNHFQHLGGTYLLGDSVESGVFDGGKLKSVTTTHLGDMPLSADNFIFASGSFFSHGLKAAPDRVYEPVFNLDVDAGTDRAAWFEKDFYKPQPYMSFGISTDEKFHAKINGKAISNLFVCGSALGGFNAVKEGCGAGVAITSALHVADMISNL